MKKLLYILLLFLPFAISAQVEEEHEVMHDNPPAEEISAGEAFRRRIPAHLKNGKPQYHHQHNLAGYILNDSVLIPLKYDDLETKYSDLMICREPRKLFGAINKKGETVIPFEYISLQKYPGDLLFGWKQNAGYGLMTYTQKVLVPFEFKKGYLGPDSIFVFFSPGRQRIVKAPVNNSVQIIMEGDFEEISVEYTGRRPFFAVKQQGRWGIMDYQKNLLVPCAYDTIHRIFDRQIVAVKDGKMGVVDLQGKVQVPFEYETINLRLKNGLFGFGVGVSPAKRKWGLVDSTGRVVLPAEYQLIDQFYHCGLMKIQKDGLYGVADPTGKIRIAPQFSELSAWEHTIYKEQKDPTGKPRKTSEKEYGIYFWCKNKDKQSSLWHIDRGQIIAPGDYEYFQIYHPDGAIVVTRQEKNAVFDMNGKQLIGYEYGSLSFSPNRPEFVTSRTDGKKTLISMRTGKQIQPEYYDDWYFNDIVEMNGYFSTKMGDFTALHAPDGRRITPHQYWGRISPCGSLPEIEARLPKGRTLVACAKEMNDTGFRFYAIDNTGAEYEYTRK